MKKVISVILAAVLVCSCFYGCSKPSVNTAKLAHTVDSHYSTYDESIVRYYEKLCTAIENGDKEIKIPSQLLDSVNQLFYTCFPMVTLVKSMTPLEDNSGFTINYVNDEETHLQLVEQFSQTVSDIMNECGYGKVSINRYLFNVYVYIAQNFTIDNSIMSTYDAIMNKKGFGSTINSTFEYLVLQGGGKACHVINYSGSSTIISTAKFNDSWYYFDVASEVADNSGKALKFFAMSSKDAKAAYKTSDFKYTDGEKIEPVKADAYSALRSCKSFTTDDKEVKAIISGEKKAFIITFK